MRVQGGCRGRPRRMPLFSKHQLHQAAPAHCLLGTALHLCAWSEGTSAQAACQNAHMCSFLRSLSDLLVWMRTRPEAASAEVAARQATPRPPYLHVAAIRHTPGNTSHQAAALPVSGHGGVEAANAAAADSAARPAHSSTSSSSCKYRHLRAQAQGCLLSQCTSCLLGAANHGRACPRCQRHG